MTIERSEFDALTSSIFSLNKEGSKVFLQWEFLTHQFEGFAYYNPKIRAIFVDYEDNTAGSGTFVLDKDTLATNIRFATKVIKNGEKTR